MTYDLRLGDCAKVLKELPDGCIDLTVTSPPYDTLDKDLTPVGRGMRDYKGYTWDFKATAKELYRVTKVGGVVVWVVTDKTDNGSESGTSFRQALYFMECGFNLHDTMIYEQAGTGAKGSVYAYWQSFEYMFILSKCRPKTVNRIEDVKNKTIGLIRSVRYREGGNEEKPHATKENGVRTNMWRYAVGFADGSDKTDHAAPFPEKLANDHIISWSNRGETILDPFLGSGTTGKMAVLNHRNFIGIEISQEYLTIAEARIKMAYDAPEQVSMLCLAE